MNEQNIVFQLISELNSVTGNDWNAQTAGGEQESELPVIVLSWDSDRISTGHKPNWDRITDQQGNTTGKEFRLVYGMDIDLEIKSRSESDRDTTAETVRDHFVPYMDDSDLFDPETSSWDIGSIQPRSIQKFSPDWYVSGFGVSLNFTKTVSKNDYDTLQNNNITITNE